jgi:hypothetical protein
MAGKGRPLPFVIQQQATVSYSPGGFAISDDPHRAAHTIKTSSPPPVPNGHSIGASSSGPKRLQITIMFACNFT